MKPLRLSIHALGGQGGGVLTDWIIDLAEHEGWTAQATSVPGVAQRTGATIYYVELAPPLPTVPLMALMPTPGDVDIVIAAELMEAGRAVARGLVTRDRTVLIASSHRIFAISEKSAMGNGMVPAAAVLEAASKQAKRLLLADHGAIAESLRAPISASLFGALAASGELPFSVNAFADTIRRSGKAVTANLAAFESALRAESAPLRPASPPLPQSVEALARLGRERLADFQDRAYADLYSRRLDAVAAADRQLGGAICGWGFTATAAQRLALWMSYEDSIRVADLKSRAQRFARIAVDAGAEHELLLVTDYLHPRFEELCDILPAGIGARLLASTRARSWAGAWLGKGRFLASNRLGGFLLLWTIARLRRFRPRTLRWREEQARIESWLESAVNAARTDYALGVEVLRLQRIIKGYGDTYARGLRSYRLIMAALPVLRERSNAAAVLRELHEAGLADEDGSTLAAALARLADTQDSPPACAASESALAKAQGGSDTYVG